MAKTHRVAVNGEEFLARRGELLLDAALMNGIHIPHDCRSGYCGTCSVRVVAGELFGSAGECEAKACQCRIVSDVAIEIEDVPDITTVAGRVTKLNLVAPDVVEVCIEPRQPVEYLPGQYLQVQFRGFSTRCYSPTGPLDRFGDGRSVHLHVRRVPGGHVSSALGDAIKTGHRVKLTGPFGSAYLRAALTDRLVLVAGGTGFAPIWSIADAAMRENSRRELVLVVGARSIESLYMIPALWRLADCPNATIIPVTDIPQAATPAIRSGTPIDHLPALYPHDIVYAAGAPNLVEAVKEVAQASGALWYADPFVSNTEESQDGLFTRAVSWLKGEAGPASPPAASTQRDLGSETRRPRPTGQRSPARMI